MEIYKNFAKMEFDNSVKHYKTVDKTHGNTNKPASPSCCL